MQRRRHDGVEQSKKPSARRLRGTTQGVIAPPSGNDPPVRQHETVLIMNPNICIHDLTLTALITVRPLFVLTSFYSHLLSSQLKINTESENRHSNSVFMFQLEISPPLSARMNLNTHTVLSSTFSTTRLLCDVCGEL